LTIAPAFPDKITAEVNCDGAVQSQEWTTFAAVPDHLGCSALGVSAHVFPREGSRLQLEVLTDYSSATFSGQGNFSATLTFTEYVLFTIDSSVPPGTYNLEFCPSVSLLDAQGGHPGVASGSVSIIANGVSLSCDSSHTLAVTPGVPAAFAFVGSASVVGSAYTGMLFMFPKLIDELGNEVHPGFSFAQGPDPNASAAPEPAMALPVFLLACVLRRKFIRRELMSGANAAA